MRNRGLQRWLVAALLTIVTLLPAVAQYGSRGDKRYRDRFERTNTYGDVVEIRLSEPGTLESKMPPAMENRVRLLHIEGPMNNDDFKYREYTVMQPLQRSYGVTEERIQAMLSKGALSSMYDESKVYELENAEELSGKDEDRLETYKRMLPTYNAIIDKLRNSSNNTLYMNPESFIPVLTSLLEEFDLDKKLIEKIADGLSVMDKSADIQKDKKGNIIYDKETKDTEIVPYLEDIDDYMEREVLPHIPDAKAFFEEDLGKKKPIIKTGAEIPFTRFFYKYKEPTKSDLLAAEIKTQEGKLADILSNLFGN